MWRCNVRISPRVAFGSCEPQIVILGLPSRKCSLREPVLLRTVKGSELVMADTHAIHQAHQDTSERKAAFAALWASLMDAKDRTGPMTVAAVEPIPAIQRRKTKKVAHLDGDDLI